jgi:hypothetical protein
MTGMTVKKIINNNSSIDAAGITPSFIGYDYEHDVSITHKR